jgi:uncharacterized protein (DUF58 family)
MSAGKNPSLPEGGIPNAREVEAIAARYKLALPETRRRRAGDSQGRNAGGSIEFHDRREFTAGDDLRHVDWRGYARTDRMLVKLYREETIPTTELVVDGSASMFVTPAKALLKLQLAWFFECVASAAQARMKIWNMGRHPVPASTAFDLAKYEPQPIENWLPALAGGPALSKCGLRIFLSDFLFPFSPSEFELAVARADKTVVIQLLSDFEADPASAGAGTLLRLENAEGPNHLEVRLDESTTREYRKRLDAMRTEMRQVLLRNRGELILLSESDSLLSCTDKFFRAGVIVP